MFFTFWIELLKWSKFENPYLKHGSTKKYIHILSGTPYKNSAKLEHKSESMIEDFSQTSCWFGREWPKRNIRVQLGNSLAAGLQYIYTSFKRFNFVNEQINFNDKFTHYKRSCKHPVPGQTVTASSKVL